MHQSTFHVAHFSVKEKDLFSVLEVNVSRLSVKARACRPINACGNHVCADQSVCMEMAFVYEGVEAIRSIYMYV